MSTYYDELKKGTVVSIGEQFPRDATLLIEACRTVDALRDENARLKGLVVKKDEALQSINEYWNGGNGSAPDACQHACDESEKALALTPASMADFVCVKREEWDKAYGYAARIDKELDAIRILADELACALNLNKGKADHG